jgi:hypothetical protein
LKYYVLKNFNICENNNIMPTFYTRNQGQYVQLKSSIPIGAKVEISSPRGLYTKSVEVEIEKNIFNLPQVTSK